MDAGTTATGLSVIRAAMQIDVAAAEPQSYVGRLTASSSTSSPIMLAYSKSACSFPWSA
jgi:hypothetical protein